MDALDTQILKFMSNKENYYDNKDVISKALCTKLSWEILKDFDTYYQKHPKVQEVDKSEYLMWYRLSHKPGKKPEEHEVYGKVIDTAINSPTPNGEVFINSLAEAKAKLLVEKAQQQLSAGGIDWDEYLRQVSGASSSLRQTEVVEAVNYSLADLAKLQRDKDGFYFRCEDLNRAIGPVRTGDVIIVAKRPEVGGTSFLVSEMSHMLEQMPKDSNAIIFNNEEAPDKVFTRMVSSALDIDYRHLMSDPTVHQVSYDKWRDGRDFDLEHNTSMTIGSIHKTLAKKKYGLIGINVLLKVGGTSATEDHDKFQALGEELRRIAQQHGPVFAIVQADPSAEGMQYIPQDRIYKSKTALQGEADILIMIGKDEDPSHEAIRYLNVAKNKIPPAPCVDLSLKHIKTEVNFDIATGRFTSRNFKGNSRASS